MFKVLSKKVPFRQQMADSDCGAACLSMVLGYYGYNVSVNYVRNLCEKYGVPESTSSMIKAGREIDLTCNLLAGDLTSLETVKSPCILHWGFNHFVVLESFKKNSIVIVDPNIGRRTITIEEVSQYFTGIYIECTPNKDFKFGFTVKNEAFTKHIKESIGTRKLKTLALGFIITSACLQLFSLLLPAITYYMVETVLPTGFTELMDSLLIVIILVGVNAVFVNLLRSSVILRFQSELDKSLVSGFMVRLLKLSPQFFLERSSGDIQSRMNSSSAIRDAFSVFTLTLFLDLFMAFTYLFVLAVISVEFAILTAALAAIQLSTYAIFLSGLKDKINEELKASANYQSYLIEILNGIFTIKTSSSEKKVKEKWDRKLNNYLIRAREKETEDAKITSVNGMLKIISPAILLWYSMSLFFEGSLSLGTVLSINSIAVLVFIPLSSLLGLVRHYHFVKSHIDRISELWLNKEERFGEKKLTLEKNKKISFKNVDFKYQSSKELLLKNISFDIEVGKRTAIVGPSGSGKSTIVSLVLGFYRPNSGKVIYENELLENYDMKQFRAKIGCVNQYSFLFNTSIRENIALNDPNLPLSEVSRAANIACIEEEILSMPMNYNCLLGESGLKLSGGQRQRISIARAVAANPELLILDEATSNLDSVIEANVADNLAEISCTQLIIAHRLSTIMSCDNIVVIEDGRITGNGTHEYLLKNNSYYRSCFNKQGGVKEQKNLYKNKLTPSIS